MSTRRYVPRKKVASKKYVPKRRKQYQRRKPVLPRGDQGFSNLPSYATKALIGKAIAQEYPNYIRPLGAAALGAGSAMLSNALLGKDWMHFGGMGDYHVKNNVFLSGRLPEMVNVPQGGGTVIRYCEYLTDIITDPIANTFNIQSFLINAANQDTFPFLSQIAQNYEQYSIEGMIFEFRSTSADALNSVNTALGSVLLGTQYDVSDDPFTTKAEMLNYEFAQSVKPSENVLHMIECEPNQTVLSNLYTLSSADPPSGKDPRFYHLGRFSIATTGFQGTSVNIGELHVTYQVRLMKPKLYQSLGLDIEYAHWSNATTVAAGTPLGASGSEVVLADTINVDHINSTQFELPAQSISKSYMCWVIYGGTAAAVVSPAITLTNCTNMGLSSLSQTPASGVSSVNLRFGFAFTTDGNNEVPLITFGTGGTIPTGSSSIVVYLYQIPNDAA